MTNLREWLSDTELRRDTFWMAVCFAMFVLVLIVGPWIAGK